ncbi:MAG: hypothetical protein RIE86_01550, partial [Imperialibacter sp.]
MKTHHCLVLALMGFISCSTPQQADNKVYTAFTGATIIDGTGAAPIQNGVLLVADGRIVAMGAKNEVTLPDNITVNDLSGKTIIPGL